MRKLPPGPILSISGKPISSSPNEKPEENFLDWQITSSA
jgi:hypothetical protein